MRPPQRSVTSMRAVSTPPQADGAFIESLMDTDLYSMGAFFSDNHPELVSELLERAAEIERDGLLAWSERGGVPVEEAFRTLLTGLAVRYYKAVAG